MNIWRDYLEEVEKNGQSKMEDETNTSEYTEVRKFNRNLQQRLLLAVCSIVCSLIDLKELTYNFQIPSSERE